MILSIDGIIELVVSLIWLPLWTSKSQTPPSHLTGFQYSWHHGARPTLAPRSPYFATMDTKSLLSRDLCSDAFGSNSTNAVCAPSTTLCCTRSPLRAPLQDEMLIRTRCALWRQISILSTVSR